MPRYKLLIEYDGTAFHGWQRQANLPTVQEEIEKAIYRLAGTYHHVQCSGRTDAGVHAYGQVAHVDLDKVYPGFVLRNALNFFLGAQRITIVHAVETHSTFHARFSSQQRSYLYRICNRPAPLAIDRDRAWHVIKPLDVQAMRQGAAYLMGTHDFTTFRAAECQAVSAIKTLERLEIAARGDQVEIFCQARSFLHHQVRNMVGTLKLVGAGKWMPDDVQTALAARDRRAGGPTAPAHGLYFMQVDYPPDLEGA